MAILTNVDSQQVLSVDEFIDHVEANTDLTDRDSVVACAEMLQGLANNKRVFLDSVNRSLKNMGTARVSAYSPANSLLGKGRTKPFVVRANFWPPITTQAAAKDVEQELFSYNLVHDHNFSFLTTNYFGPGYETDVWTYRHPGSVHGEIGEKVQLDFQGRLNLAPKTQIFFEQGVDVHTQLPPPDFSVSINLLITEAATRLRPQHIVDPVRSIITGYPLGTISSRRVVLMKIASEIGDGNTLDILDQIKKTTPCHRTRSASEGAIDKLTHIHIDGQRHEVAHG
jgi:hypothetical protein